MPRAAGMVKSTASQQQDTMRDMKRPKSWTAGIDLVTESRGDVGSGLEPRGPEVSAAKGT